MLTSESKRKLTAGAMFGLPIALVWITGQMLSGPQSAKASETTPVPVAAIPAPDDTALTIEVDPASAAAGAYVVELKRLDFGPTPLYHAAAGGDIVVIGDPEDSPPPIFEINAIMASSGGNTALIDGMAFRVGERLGESGWRISEIDAIARSVTIREIGSERTSKVFVKRGRP